MTRRRSRRPPRAVRQYLVHRVIVNLTEGSYDGLLWDMDDQLVILRQATIHMPGQEPIKATGDVILERQHVRFMQAPAEYP